jgi:hypothetical protein
VDGDRIYETIASWRPTPGASGIADELLDWAERRSEVAEAAPATGRPGSRALRSVATPELEDALVRRGYEAARWEAEMLRPDLERIEDVPSPGLSPPPQANELPAVFRMSVEAFAEHWGGPKPASTGSEEWVEDRASGGTAGRGLARRRAGGAGGQRPRDARTGRSSGCSTACAHPRPAAGLARACIVASLRLLRELGATSAYLGVDTGNHNRARDAVRVVRVPARHQQRHLSQAITRPTRSRGEHRPAADPETGDVLDAPDMRASPSARPAGGLARDRRRHQPGPGGRRRRRGVVARDAAGRVRARTGSTWIGTCCWRRSTAGSSPSRSGYAIERGTALSLESWGAVLGEQRRRGIGTALHRATRARLAEQAALDPSPKPRSFRSFALDIRRDDIGLLEREGYVPIRFGFEMRRFLTGRLPIRPLPVGLEIRPVTPDQHRAIFDADNEAFRDHWGHREQTDGDFRARFEPRHRHLDVACRLGRR